MVMRQSDSLLFLGVFASASTLITKEKKKPHLLFFTNSNCTVDLSPSTSHFWSLCLCAINWRDLMLMINLMLLLVWLCMSIKRMLYECQIWERVHLCRWSNEQTGNKQKTSAVLPDWPCLCFMSALMNSAEQPRIKIISLSLLTTILSLLWFSFSSIFIKSK